MARRSRVCVYQPSYAIAGPRQLAQALAGPRWLARALAGSAVDEVPGSGAGVSNSTTGGNDNAAVAVFNRSTHALICSTAASGAQQCPNVGSRWTDGSVSFAPGDDVTLAVSYDRSTGRDHFFVDDDTTGVELFYSGYVPGTGKIYTQARVGAEFAADPWGNFRKPCGPRHPPISA
jgi:hypothetical protein